MDGTVLIADDDRTIRTVLSQALTRAGCKVHATSSLTTLLRWVREGLGDVVITDVMMPDGNGLEMLPRITEDRPGLPVIVISAQNTIMTAIGAEKSGAFDYLPKPFDLPDLLKRTGRALSGRDLQTPAVDLPPDDLPLIGKTPVMQELYRVIARIMNADLPVLIQGESGTGKSLIARLLHEFSDRRGGKLINADFEAHDDVASVFAQAAGGTVLLDDITRIPIGTQARIAAQMDRAANDAPRVLGCLQGDPAEALKTGTLRKDFYYRLGGAVLELPALRDRADDIPVLARHFLDQHAVGYQFADPALAMLRAHPWPGNVRQLESTVRRLALSGHGGLLTADHVKAVLETPGAGATPEADADTEKLGASVHRHLQRYFDLHEGMLPPSGLYARIIREVELPLIEIALEATGGNQAKCADLLGINRNTLRKKITDLDIEVTRRRKLM